MFFFEFLRLPDISLIEHMRTMLERQLKQLSDAVIDLRRFQRKLQLFWKTADNKIFIIDFAACFEKFRNA